MAQNFYDLRLSIMIEFLLNILPLIFVCSAIGILLINFPTVSAYIIYVFSMLTKPQELLETSRQMSPTSKTIPKQKNIFIPFIRAATLFRVLFFPNMDLESMANSKKQTPEETLRSIYSEKAQEEIDKYQIKTYSANALNDNSKFKYSYEPVDSIPLSDEFQKAFPDLTKKLSTQQKLKAKEYPEIIPINNGESTIDLSNIRNQLRQGVL